MATCSRCISGEEEGEGEIRKRKLLKRRFEMADRFGGEGGSVVRTFNGSFSSLLPFFFLFLHRNLWFD